MMADEENPQTVKDRIKMFSRDDDKAREGKLERGARVGSRKKMQSDTALFEKPHQLIETDPESNQLQYVEETLNLLRRIDKQVNVVAITGVYRTGKSYLLNRLAGGSTGFGIGKTSNACTKGIWIWCREHPVQQDQVLVLLDVEGFGDVYKGEQEHLLMFTLATLLCSTMVYNNKGAFDLEAMKRLRFLDSLDSNLCYIDSHNDLDVFDFYFPKFILCLRDFNLQLTTKDGKKTSPRGYFEDVLSQQKGDDVEVRKYNRIRLLIRNYFKKRTCFTFKMPCMDPENMENMEETEFHTDFLQSLKSFQNYVYSCKPMAMVSGQPINGRMFASLVQTYLGHVSEGKTPCLRTAFKEMAYRENEAVLEQASIIYSEEMKRRLGAVNPNESGFIHHHKECMDRASEYFKQAVVFDDEQVCSKQIQERFKELFNKFKKICDKNSELHCSNVLKSLNLTIVLKLKENAYAKEGGYEEYWDDLKTLEKKYDGTCGLGTRSQESLEKFLDEKSEEIEMVYALALKASETDEEKSIPRQDERPSICRPKSYSEELSEQIEYIRRRLSAEYREKQAETYEEIRQKNIEKLSLQLQEIERQLQEKVDENTKALEDDKNYLTKLIVACKHIDKLSDDFKRTLLSRPMEIESLLCNTVDTSKKMGGTIYEVPWEFQPIRQPPEGSIDTSAFKEESPKTSLKRKRFCFIQ